MLTATARCEAAAMAGFTGGGGQAGDGEMKLRPAGQTLAGKINTTSPFLPCATPISLTTLPSLSLPFRKCSLIIYALMCYSAFPLFVSKLQMTARLSKNTS